MMYDIYDNNCQQASENICRSDAGLFQNLHGTYKQVLLPAPLALESGDRDQEDINTQFHTMYKLNFDFQSLNYSVKVKVT